MNHQLAVMISQEVNLNQLASVVWRSAEWDLLTNFKYLVDLITRALGQCPETGWS